MHTWMHACETAFMDIYTHAHIDDWYIHIACIHGCDIHACMHAHMPACIKHMTQHYNTCMNANNNLHVITFTFIYKRVWTCIRVYMFKCIIYIYTIYLYTHARMHTYKHMHAHKHAYIYIRYIHINIHKYMHARIHACMNAMHTYIHVYMHARIYTYMYAPVLASHKCRHACIHTYTHNTSMNACIHIICTHAYITYIYMHYTTTYIARAHIYIYTIMHTCMHALHTCIDACIYNIRTRPYI